MRITTYLNEKKALLLVCAAGGLLFSLLLWLFDLGIGEILLLWICFLCIAGSQLLWDYRSWRRRFLYLTAAMDELDQKYLFAEITDSPASELERQYFTLMRTALKAMTDEVAKASRTNKEYRDFIEQWIHEIKVPVTGIQLICANNRSDVTREIAVQTERISQDVERVLFYARLGSVEKDYLITEVSLKACVLDVLAQNKQFLIQNNACIHTESLSGTVYSDQKWLEFIINQILQNSIRYQGSEPPVIDVTSQDQGTYVTLSVTDHGIGIQESELSRVFDKGFVGSNGRNRKQTTGLGLYLCDQLCAKLGIGIGIESEAGKYTTVHLHFPKGDFLSI